MRKAKVLAQRLESQKAGCYRRRGMHETQYQRKPRAHIKLDSPKGGSSDYMFLCYSALNYKYVCMFYLFCKL